MFSAARLSVQAARTCVGHNKKNSAFKVLTVVKHFQSQSMENIPLPPLKDILPRIASEQHFVDYDLDVKPISSGGANYTGKLYNVTISEGARKLHLFAKVATLPKAMRGNDPKIYITERYYYRKLAGLYDRLQEDHHVPEEHRLVPPKYYGSIPKECEETIVLEDLVKNGYMPYDRFRSVDWAYTQAAAEVLAKMHALSFAHAKYYPENFKKVLHDFQFPDDSLQRSMVTLIPRAIQLINEEHRDKVARFYENEYDPETYEAKYKSSRRPVVTHGDYRPSNLMHKYRSDGKVDIKIVDFQTLQGGSPVTDLIYFIFTGSDEEFRKHYFEKLLDHYYTELSAAMKRLGVDPEETFSRKDFDEEMKEKLPFGLSLAVFALPVITVETENAPKVNENLDVTSFTVDKPSPLYAERLNGVVNDYVKWGILK